MIKQELWSAVFKNEYASLVGTIPSINPGTDPARDLAIVSHLGYSRSYMLTYPMDKFTTEYWNVFLAMFPTTAGVDINLSTALVVCERLLGDRVLGLGVPDAWILSIEILAPDQTSKVL